MQSKSRKPVSVVAWLYSVVNDKNCLEYSWGTGVLDLKRDSASQLLLPYTLHNFPV